MSINNKLLPVPLEYTYPIVMKIHPNPKPFSELIYLPELRKWILSCNLLRFFKIHKIDPIVWKGRWLYKKLVNIGDDNWINLKMQIDYPIVMRHTKDYIINNLKNDINFKCKPSIIVKEDFKDQLKRDSNVRNYCRENNIILLEIPYTYNTYKKVEQLLNRAILGGEDINSIIDYSKLYKI